MRKRASLSNDRTALTAGLILGVAALLRLVAVSRYPARPLSDAADYHQLAADLANGRGYIDHAGRATAWRPPGYPAFVSLIYRLFGPHYRTAYAVQVVVGVAVVLLLMVLAAHILDKRTALIAGAIAAVLPTLVWLPRVLLSENLAVVTLVLTLLIAVNLARTGSSRWAAALGAALGVGELVRALTVLLAVVLLPILGFLLLRKFGGRRAAIALVSIATAALVILFPWALRNERAMHGFVPVATQDGLALYSSYWPPVHGAKRIWGNDATTADPIVAHANARGEVLESRELRTYTITYLAGHPGYWVSLLPDKLRALVVPYDYEVAPQPARGHTINWGYVLLILPALVGMGILIRRRWSWLWVVGAVWASILIQTVVFYGSPRFRIDAEVVAIIPAAYAIRQAVERMRRHTGASQAEPPGGLSVLHDHSQVDDAAQGSSRSGVSAADEFGAGRKTPSST